MSGAGYDLVVVGGGAAGMMAAITAARLGAQVCLVERNPKVGRKLYITGKGRCNVTNHCSPEEVLAAVPRNGRCNGGNGLHRLHDLFHVGQDGAQPPAQTHFLSHLKTSPQSE